MSYVDLHLHLLPGVDDGPADLDESLRHARLLARDGVGEATVTPHVGHPWFEIDPAGIAAHTRALQTELDAARIPLRLRPGGELHPDAVERLTTEQLDAIAQGPPGARWVLAEVPFAGVDEAWVAACAQLHARGFGVLIGHPERAADFLADGRGRLAPLLALGAGLQVNVCSLAGAQGDEARAGALRLVLDGTATVLASDGHGGSRRLTLRDGFYAALEAGASPERARCLTQANPAALLHHGLEAITRPVRLAKAA